MQQKINYDLQLMGTERYRLAVDTILRRSDHAQRTAFICFLVLKLRVCSIASGCTFFLAQDSPFFSKPAALVFTFYFMTFIHQKDPSRLH